MKKSGKLMIAALATAALGIGILVNQETAWFNKLIEKQPSTEERQLAYLKANEKEIIDFVKSLNPKIESVQIDWNQTQWDQIGNGTPWGGGEVIYVYGGFNHIENSSWSVLIYIREGHEKDYEGDWIEGIGTGSQPSIGADLLE